MLIITILIFTIGITSTQCAAVRGAKSTTPRISSPLRSESPTGSAPSPTPPRLMRQEEATENTSLSALIPFFENTMERVSLYQSFIKRIQTKSEDFTDEAKLLVIQKAQEIIRLYREYTKILVSTETTFIKELTLRSFFEKIHSLEKEMYLVLQQIYAA